MSGVEVFMRGLYELASGDSQYSICENIFGRDQSQQSRAFNWFIEHVESTFFDILSDNLEWFKREGYFENSRRAITEKLAQLGCEFSDDRPQLVAGFIDCNCMETCRVGGGPRSGKSHYNDCLLFYIIFAKLLLFLNSCTDGPDSDRWSCLIQQAFYNGWKSIHGLKHQTVDNAYGITMDIAGPTSVRANDLRVLGDSDMIERLNDLFAGEDVKYKIFGDSIVRVVRIFRCKVVYSCLISPLV
jgi:hypothetical protein